MMVHTIRIMKHCRPYERNINLETHGFTMFSQLPGVKLGESAAIGWRQIRTARHWKSKICWPVHVAPAACTSFTLLSTVVYLIFSFSLPFWQETSRESVAERLHTRAGASVSPSSSLFVTHQTRSRGVWIIEGITQLHWQAQLQRSFPTGLSRGHKRPNQRPRKGWGSSQNPLSGIKLLLWK